MLIIGLFRKADTYASLTVFFFFIEIVWNNIHLMHLFIVHPRRPRGSQSGREKRQDENFQVRAKEPPVPTLTELFPKIQADVCFWLGTKNALYYCAQSANSFSWVLFVSSYTTAIFSGSCTKEMHAVSKLSVWYKISIWFQNIICPKFTFFQSL